MHINLLFLHIATYTTWLPNHYLNSTFLDWRNRMTINILYYCPYILSRGRDAYIGCFDLVDLIHEKNLVRWLRIGWLWWAGDFWSSAVNRTAALGFDQQGLVGVPTRFMRRRGHWLKKEKEAETGTSIHRTCYWLPCYRRRPLAPYYATARLQLQGLQATRKRPPSTGSLLREKKNVISNVELFYNNSWEK